LKSSVEITLRLSPVSKKVRLLFLDQGTFQALTFLETLYIAPFIKPTFPSIKLFTTGVTESSRTFTWIIQIVYSMVMELKFKH
jgi:hypothetical protein